MIRSLAFAPNGDSVVTASEDATVRVWDLTTDERSIAELEALARVLGSHKINQAGGYVPADSAVMKEAWALIQPHQATAVAQAADAVAASRH
jgi:hypothetical protein